MNPIQKKLFSLKKINIPAGLNAIAVLIFLITASGKPVDALRSVRLLIRWDVFMVPQEQFINLPDSIDIYAYKGYKVYGSTTQHDSSSIDRDGVQHFLGSQVKHAYFIVKDGEKKGYWYNELSVKKPFVADVDSFLTHRCSSNFPFYLPNVQMLIEKTTRSGIDIETYKCREKKDRSYYDTLHYYFDKRLKDVPYALSSFLDSTRHSKLSKVLVIYNPQPADDKGPASPRRVFNFELKAVPGTEEQNKVALFVDRFIAGQQK